MRADIQADAEGKRLSRKSEPPPAGSGDGTETEEILNLLSDERVVRLVEGLPVAVLIYDSTGKPRFSNGLFEELAGTSTEPPGPDLTAGRLSEIFHLCEAGSDRPYPPERSPLVRALAGVTSTVEDMEVRRPGVAVPVEVSAAPIFGETGEVAYAVAVFKDITRRRSAERAYRTAAENYRSSIENALDGVFQSTPEGRFLTVNSSMARMWGYDTPAEMVADIEDLSRNYARPEVRDELKRLMEAEGSVRGFMAEIRRRDGSVIWTTITARAVADEAGDLLYFEGRMSDITEGRKAAQAIVDSEQKYRTLVEMSPDAIVLIDFNFKILASNRQAASMFGYEDKVLLEGTSVLERVAPQDRVHAHDEVMKAIQEENAITGEYTLLRRDGAGFPAEVRVAAVQGGGGKRTSFIAVIRDVTSRKQSEEALRKMNAELDGYAHTVSHDLKNPLSAILMGSETLAFILGQPDSPEKREDMLEIARVIADSSDRATALIEDLLVLAEAGQEPGDLEDVDVREVVMEVLEDRAAEIEDRNVKVSVDEDLGSIKVNRTHLYQVFSNLIGNAIIHSDNPRPEVAVTLAGGGAGPPRFRVRDNGSGIPAHVLDGVFLPFTKGPTGQTGIGLAIVDKIVRSYNGEVQAFNDRGAVFEVAFAGGEGVEEEEVVT